MIFVVYLQVVFCMMTNCRHFRIVIDKDVFVLYAQNYF